MHTTESQTSLLRDHAEIEALLRELLVAFDSGDRQVATDAFETFERRVSAHLALEDETLLPVLAELDPREAAELAVEHRALRAAIDELAIEDNLHVSRKTEVERLVEMLRAHASREQTTLYKLADLPAVQRRLEDVLGAGHASVASHSV